MRRILLRSVIGIACLGAVLIAWVAGSRSLSMLLDRLHTVEIESQPIAQLGIEDANRGMLQVNDLPMSTGDAELQPLPDGNEGGCRPAVCCPVREPRDRARTS